MASLAHRLVGAHAQCGGGGGEGAARAPLDAQRTPALQISESAFASSSSVAQRQLALAPFPPGCQPGGTFSTIPPLRGQRDTDPKPLQSCELWGCTDTWCPFLARGTRRCPDVRQEPLTSAASAGGGHLCKHVQEGSRPFSSPCSPLDQTLLGSGPSALADAPSRSSGKVPCCSPSPGLSSGCFSLILLFSACKLGCVIKSVHNYLWGDLNICWRYWCNEKSQ